MRSADINAEHFTQGTTMAPNSHNKRNRARVNQEIIAGSRGEDSKRAGDTLKSLGILDVMR